MQLHDELLLQQNQDAGSSNIIIDENSCRFIVKLSLMQPKYANSDEYDYHGTNLLRNFAQVSSFNRHSSNSLVQFQGGTSLSGVMLPAHDADVCANNDMLIIGGRGYEKSAQKDYWEDYTFIVGFDLLNGMAMQSAIGKIKGHLLINSHLIIMIIIYAWLQQLMLNGDALPIKMENKNLAKSRLL